MTDTPRRRDNDKEAADLYPLVESMIEQIGRIDATLTTEVAAHASLAPLNHAHPKLESDVAQIIDVLEGPEKPRPFGQPPTRDDGLVDAVAIIQATQVTQGRDISAIKETLGNGGIKIKIPPGAWVAIIVAIITGLFNIAAVFAGR